MYKTQWLTPKNDSGFSIIEMMVAAGILSVIILAAATFFTNQLRSNNFLEFQAKREQLRLTLMGQVLRTPDNCKCLFKNAADFSSTLKSDLTGYATPVEIAKYQGANCTNPDPVVNTTGFDSLKLKNVTLQSIEANPSGLFGGHLTVDIESTKDVMGPKTLRLDIPVNVVTIPASATTVKFDGCTTSGDFFSGGTATGPVQPGTPLGSGTIFSTSCRHGTSCDAQAIALCASYMNGAPHCVKDIYSTVVDGGDKNAGTEGYICTVGLCTNGTTSDFTQPYKGEQ